MISDKVRPHHLERKALLSDQPSAVRRSRIVRQSSAHQAQAAAWTAQQHLSRCDCRSSTTWC
jgi:hypothetical protein